MLAALLSAIIAFSIIGTAIEGVIISNFSAAQNNNFSEESFNIAEAGINYYLFHLNVNSSDYQDGQTNATYTTGLGYGPFVHLYVNLNGQDIGTYTIYVNPQSLTGTSSLVTITSIGQETGSAITRTVQAEIGRPSFASYGVVSDSPLWFGNNETANGPVDSNQGIRMDGPNTSTVSSGQASYTPPYQLGGDGNSHPGVWCSTTVTSPVNCSTRSQSQWVYPVSTINFNQVTGSLCSLKEAAFSESSATSSLLNSKNPCSQTPSTLTTAYLPELYRAYSPVRGYLIILNSNNTYDLYGVTYEDDTQANYQNALYDYTISTNNPIPSGGVIFAEDNVWVVSNGNFNGRVTIAAGRMQAGGTSQYANITIAGPLTYASKNGSDAIGLVSQNNITVAPYAPPPPNVTSFTFEIDAALLAENGSVEFPGTYRYYPWYCTTGWTNSSQQFLFYGSVATRQDWTWTWLDGSSPCGNAGYDPVNGYVSGIENNSTQYDYNLYYNPPPDYPLALGYNIISWRDVIAHP